MKSFGKISLKKVSYFENERMLSLLNTKQPTTYSNTDKTKPNVVIILLESFSKEYTQLKNPEATPYLNELAKKSVFFDKAYANGRRSIEGVASVLSGIPALMEEPFVNSEFSANQIIGLGTLLGSNGYHTSFFHGAKNGSMHFDQFSKSVGIENYFGKSEYPNALDDDGTWGIFDEPFLRWTCAKYSDFPKPFFSTIFTLSSHQPFKIPDQFENDFSDGRA